MVPDGPPSGNGVCYGPSGWQVCFGAVVSGPVQLQGSLDTDKSDGANPCLKNLPTSWTASQPAACIIVGDTVTISSLNVTGSRPLVIVAQTQITVTGLLDLSSKRSPAVTGAGAASAGGCKPFGGAPTNGAMGGGGGAGGTFRFQGGGGGPGDGVNQQGGTPGATETGAPSRLRGGCPGQPGGGGAQSDGGDGGGAVYLVSAGMISIPGKIDASGAGGAGVDAQHGGGGGGSGGTILLHAPMISTTPQTVLIAAGGGGGGGSAQSGSMMKGGDGQEPAAASPIVAALGGGGGILIGFTGGDGGSGYPAVANTIPGLNGRAGDQGAGGGGGGGGGGYILANHAITMGALSPPDALSWP